MGRLYSQAMSTDAQLDRALQTRVAVTAILLGVAMMIDAVLSIAFGLTGRAGDAAIAHLDEIVARENTEIDARLAESKSDVEESERLVKQANDLDERAAKIEASLRRSAKSGK
jgi:hypothetical protein